MTADEFRAAAATFLAGRGDVVAWEPTKYEKQQTALDRFASGLMPQAMLAAAFDIDRDRRTKPAPKGSGIALLTLWGVLVAYDSVLTWLGIGTSVSAFRNSVRAAAADPSVRGLLVDVNSPGGHVDQIPETHALLRQVREKKPVVMAISGTAASAAYWLASAGTQIIATPSANIGGIGVFAERVSLARRLDQDGIDVAVISAGKHKADGHPATTMSDDERAALQKRVDETYGVFVADVAAGRRVTAATVTATYGQGRVVSAATAKAVGMIDSIATIEDTVARVVSPDAAAATARMRQELVAAAVAPLRAAEAASALASMRADLEARIVRS